MRPKVSEIATGKWRALLLGFGLTERQLSGKHCPCPICGGHDRFRFDDKDGRGTWFCSHCRAGDGIKLVMAFKGWDFKTAAREIEQAAGVVQACTIQHPQGEAEKLERLRRVWSESNSLQIGDEVVRYLSGRGLLLPKIPSDLRFHPGMACYEDDKFVGKFPVMLARVVSPEGESLTIHRTFLKDGHKAPIASAKKLMPGKPMSGGAIRLFSADKEVGIAEGIETALAASEMFGVPVWSCISANGIETFQPPPGIERVVIFADNDASFTGQRSAFACAFRLKQQGIEVDVKFPDTQGDWLDVLIASKREWAVFLLALHRNDG